MGRASLWLILPLSQAIAIESVADWKPAPVPISSRFAQDVHPDRVHPEYPRPQMYRERWANLNGLWDFTVRPRDKGDSVPDTWDGKILVPFPMESSLSGVGRRLEPTECLWYHRSFRIPHEWSEERILLHFGGVDWETQVWVDGQAIGDPHRGGYDPFSLDITEALDPKRDDHEVIVRVEDPTDTGTQPRGKQVLKPHSIWYTPSSGIWQTVWLEPVGDRSLAWIHQTSDLAKRRLRLEVGWRGLDRPAIAIARDLKARLRLEPWNGEIEPDGKRNGNPGDESTVVVGTSQTSEIEIDLSRVWDKVTLWTPDTPVLYRLEIIAREADRVIDRVESYVGFRSIALGADERGRQRLLLNGQPLFQYGLLDQGFWPEGLYTAPTDEALRYDLDVTKDLGFNMVRKHVKVEPARWYYWCDRLGLLVWQDMPSGDRSILPIQPDIRRSPESDQQFRQEWGAIIRSLINHPSIVMWVPFNEGWGQYQTAAITEFTREQDPTRLVNSTSGWADRKVGDVRDIHIYPGPKCPELEPNRAAVLGEFGGLGLPVPGRLWQEQQNWGYRTFKSRATLEEAYLDLQASLLPLVAQGLAAAVYTQTTDVEIEVNGLLTYDRAELKLDRDRVREAHRRLYLPLSLESILPTAPESTPTWRYTTSKPADGWEKPDADDSNWLVGEAGFGTPETPGSIVSTPWKSDSIWLRRNFDWTPQTSNKSDDFLLWNLHHDEDVIIYLNGIKVLERSGYVTDYQSIRFSAEAMAALRPGRNTLAVRCQQTGGGQYIDVGIQRLHIGTVHK